MSETDAASTFACELARRDPLLFAAAVEEYGVVIESSIEEALSGTDRHTRGRIRALARKLGAEDAVPQDLVAIHLSTLAGVVKSKPHALAKACVRHSRLLLVKMVGELALFYRDQARQAMGVR